MNTVDDRKCRADFQWNQTIKRLHLIYQLTLDWTEQCKSIDNFVLKIQLNRINMRFLLMVRILSASMSAVTRSWSRTRTGSAVWSTARSTASSSWRTIRCITITATAAAAAAAGWGRRIWTRSERIESFIIENCNFEICVTNHRLGNHLLGFWPFRSSGWRRFSAFLFVCRWLFCIRFAVK